MPIRGVLVTLACLVFGVLLNYLLPGRIFEVMMSILSFNTVWTWSMVLIAHFQLSPSLRQDGVSVARLAVDQRDLPAF